MVSCAYLRFEFLAEVVYFYLDALNVLVVLVLLIIWFYRGYLVNTAWKNFFLCFSEILSSFFLMDRALHTWHGFPSLMKKLLCVKFVIFRNYTEIGLRKNRSFGIESCSCGLWGNFILNWFLIIDVASLVIFGSEIV